MRIPHHRTESRKRRDRLAQCSRYILLLSLLVACGEETSPGPILRLADSAGVSIVEFDLDRLSAFASLSAEPDWIFGESQDNPGDEPLSDVRVAKFLRDGRIAIINGVSEEVLVVKPEEPAVRMRLAGEGKGPGTAEFLTSVWEDDRGIGAYDLYRREVSYFDQRGYAGSWRPPETGVPGPLYPEIVLPDGGGGHILGDLYSPWNERANAFVRRNLLVARVRENAVDTIAVVPGDTGKPMAFGLEPLPFGAAFALALHGEGVWLGDSDLPQLSVRDWQGKLMRLVRWRSSADRRLTQRKIDRAMRAALAGKPQSIQRNIRRWWKDAPFPPLLPAWGLAVSGAEGSLWLSDYPGPEVDWPRPAPYPVLMWWGISADGRPLGTLLSPARVKVTDICETHLLGIHTDEMNVQTVVRYRIEKGNLEIPPR